MSIQQTNKNGLILKDIRDFVDKSKNLSDDIPITVECNDNLKEITLYDIIADNESITFYDY